MSKPRYVTVTLTKKQMIAAENALANLASRKETAYEIADMRDSTAQWEREAIFRLRSAMLSATRDAEQRQK